MSIQLDLNKEIQLDLDKGITLDLEKGDFVNLSKNRLDHVVLRAGCGWNCRQVEKKGLFGFKRQVMEDVDLDLTCSLEDANGQVIDRVYFNHRSVPGLRLDQDDRSGSTGWKDVDQECRSLDKDNENIIIRLDQVPASVDQIRIGVVIYNQGRQMKGQPNHTFDMIDNAYCKLVDETNRRVLCSVKMSEKGRDRTAVMMAIIKRYQGQWVFEAAEEYSYAHVLSF